MEKNKVATVFIGEAASQAGVTVKQLRHWQDRGYIPTAQRVICGQRAYRSYSPSDLNIIREIKAMLDQGYTIAAAAQKVNNNQKNQEV